jgi:hypothetical protein
MFTLSLEGPCPSLSPVFAYARSNPPTHRSASNDSSAPKQKRLAAFAASRSIIFPMNLG